MYIIKRRSGFLFWYDLLFYNMNKKNWWFCSCPLRVCFQRKTMFQSICTFYRLMNYFKSMKSFKPFRPFKFLSFPFPDTLFNARFWVYTQLVQIYISRLLFVSYIVWCIYNIHLNMYLLWDHHDFLKFCCICFFFHII